jgi:hypothetical protein
MRKDTDTLIERARTARAASRNVIREWRQARDRWTDSLERHRLNIDDWNRFCDWYCWGTAGAERRNDHRN